MKIPTDAEIKSETWIASDFIAGDSDQKTLYPLYHYGVQKGLFRMRDHLKPQIEELEKRIEQLEKERDENKEKIHFYDKLAASGYFNLNQSDPPK